MDFSEYQRRAMETRISPAVDNDEAIVAILGLAGEVGELLSAYKKLKRDGDSYEGFTSRASEELGDLLWYLSDVATHFGLELDKIAVDNLQKCTDRWGKQLSHTAFDDDYPDAERLPRRLEVEFTDEWDAPSSSVVRIYVDGNQVGNDLTDNSYMDDGYRFHDVFHLACMAVLGWSPVMRKMLRCKRSSRKLIDEVEDGARARVTEEAVSALVYAYARAHSLLEGISVLDSYLLRSIKDITSHLEVSVRKSSEWEDAILMAYEVWRELISRGGGRVRVDMDRQCIELTPSGS